MTCRSMIITGASRGIGEHMAYEALKRGFSDLTLIARDEAELVRVQKQARSLFPNAKVDIAPLDLSHPEAAAQIFSKWPNVDVFVHNAALGAMGRFHDFELERYEKMIRLNVDFTSRITYLYSKQMQANKKGVLFHIASVGGILPLPFQTLYSATKAFMITLCEALDEELRRDGVRVLAFCPGGTNTEFMRTSGFDLNAVQTKKAFLATPESVAAAAIDALLKQKRTAASDLGNTMIAVLSRWLPKSLTLPLVRKVYLGFLPK